MVESGSLSVVIPVFNRPQQLATVLQGLATQSMNFHEVLVCDDGSTDDLAPAIGKFADQLPLRYLRQENKGPSAARNLGTRHSSGDLVLYLDSDVQLPDPQAIERLRSALQNNPDWAGAEACVKATGGEDNLLWEAPVSGNGGVYLTACMLFRRAVIFQVGGFDEAFNLVGCEDVELACRILPLGAIGFVADATIEHPRRKKTAGYYWRNRRSWRPMTYLALRHRCIGWPENPTRFPRLRLSLAAVLTQPLGRILNALRLLGSRPVVAVTGLGHALVCELAGISALPLIWGTREPERRNYLRDHADD